MASFITPLELAAYLDGTVDEADLEDSWIVQATSLIEAISDDIENEAGVPIEAGAGTVILAGTYSRDLELPAGPVRDVSAVTIDGVALVAGSYWWNERALIRRGAMIANLDAVNSSGDYERGYGGAGDRDGYPWGSPASTVRVTYEWGFAAVPGFVKSLTKRIAARTLPNIEGVVQESLAVYSVTYQSSREASGSHVRPAERRRLRKSLTRTAGTITAAGR